MKNQETLFDVETRIDGTRPVGAHGALYPQNSERPAAKDPSADGGELNKSKAEPPVPELSPNDVAAAAFDAENPDFYRHFRDLARLAISRGFRKYSARTLIEVMRWNSDVRISGTGWKINDHNTPYFARKFLAEPGTPPGFFELRR